MEKAFKVVLAQTAVEIFDQINAQWGETAAKKFERKVFKTLDILSKSPLIFKVIEAHSNVRKGLIDKNCSFFYEVSNSQIQILLFWDNRQDPLFE